MSTTEQASGPSELELLKGRARLLGVEFSNNIGLETLKERVNAHLKEIGDEPLPVPPAQPNPLEPDTNAAPIPAQTGQGVSGEAPAPIPAPLDPVAAQAADFDSDIAEEPVEQQTNAGAPVPPQPFKLEAPEVKPQRVIDPTPATALGSATTAKSGKQLSVRQQMYNEQMKLIRVRIHNMDPKKSSLQGEIITVANRILGNVKVFVPFGEATEDGWHIPYIIYKELNRRKFLAINSVRDKNTKQIKVTKKWMKEFALDVLPPLTESELARLATAQLAAGSIDNSAGDML